MRELLMNGRLIDGVTRYVNVLYQDGLFCVTVDPRGQCLALFTCELGGHWGLNCNAGSVLSLCTMPLLVHWRDKARVWHTSCGESLPAAVAVALRKLPTGPVASWPEPWLPEYATGEKEWPWGLAGRVVSQPLAVSDALPFDWVKGYCTPRLDQ